jgi:UDP-glucose:(heptosyl)LPS alpha-1,3-glucosyltransferase
VLLVTDRADWSDGGGRERYSSELVDFLARAGRKVTVLSSSSAHADILRPAAAIVRPLRERRLRATITARRHRDPTEPVLALAPIGGATHYQLHGGLLTSAFAAERESMQSATRRLLFGPASALNLRRQHLLAGEDRLLSSGTALMAFSNRTARELIATRGVADDRVVVARPGVDLNCFRPLSIPREEGEPRMSRLRLAFVGHNFELKGLRTAILAVAELRRGGTDTTLVVAGRGRQASYVRTAARARVASHVTFVGVLPQHELADLYRDVDALVHPTFYDPFPRVVIEALACGCPVVTSERCGAAEILTDGSEGFVTADPHDVWALAAAIARIHETRGSMRQAAAVLGARFDAATHFQFTLKWLESPGPSFAFPSQPD